MHTYIHIYIHVHTHIYCVHPVTLIRSMCVCVCVCVRVKELLRNYCRSKLRSLSSREGWKFNMLSKVPAGWNGAHDVKTTSFVCLGHLAFLIHSV